LRGILYIVATPIGNLEDITYRATRILAESKIIFAEDTRLTKNLLNHYNINTQLMSCNSKNEEQRIPMIKNFLDQGDDVSIVSDAGTPGISDPSVRVVSYFRSIDYIVSPIPGPSAVITALSASGVPTDKFTFLGFPPQKKGRQTFFKNAEKLNGTIILYESPHRMDKTLHQIHEYIGNRYIVIARELTKKFEEFLSGKVEDLLASEIKIKGEFVIVICDEKFYK
jgi:16S rRNA (cytidine1402-2'-O)-methyltransferase